MKDTILELIEDLDELSAEPLDRLVPTVRRIIEKAEPLVEKCISLMREEKAAELLMRGNAAITLHNNGCPMEIIAELVAPKDERDSKFAVELVQGIVQMVSASLAQQPVCVRGGPVGVGKKPTLLVSVDVKGVEVDLLLLNPEATIGDLLITIENIAASGEGPDVLDGLSLSGASIEDGDGKIIPVSTMIRSLPQGTKLKLRLVDEPSDG